MGYVIKKTAIATEKHPTRIGGEIIEFILVKGGYVRTTGFILKEEQYKSKGIATRVMNNYIKSDRMTDNDFWDNKYEVVEV